MARKILIILDGFADSLRYGRTSLDMARTPNLDYLACHGECGLMHPIKTIAPESGASQFVLLGGRLADYPRRGVIEALGAGIKMNDNDLALRANFAKVSNGNIVKLRVSIPSKKIIGKINSIDRGIQIFPTIDYRAILIVKDAKTSDVSNTHPGYKNYKNYSQAIDPKTMMKKNCVGNERICARINKFVNEAERIMGGGKTILLREAGLAKNLPRVKPMKNWVFMGDMPVEKGLAKLFGMKILERKKDFIEKIINMKENVYIQIKGADSFGHIGDKKGKIKAIEKMDDALKPLRELVRREDVALCVTSDHATPPELKRHSNDAVPVLIFNGRDMDIVLKFSERTCSRGNLGLFEGKDLLNLLK